MKTKFAVPFILIVFILSGIRAMADEQTRKVDPFTSISLRISANVHLKQGERQDLKIEAKSSTLEEILTEVKDGELIIRFPNKDYFWNSFQPGEITIYLTTPEIYGLAVSGSGNIVADQEIRTERLDLALSGSGSIKLYDLVAGQVKSSISGSGNISLAGNTPARDLSATISGSGNVKAINYSADDVTVHVSGSGNVSIGANKNLNVRVSGSGNVNYKGDPMIDSAISGSGKVKNVN
jgi:hypothetical protein